MVFIKVIKRSGKKVKFNYSKIYIAIEKAFEDTTDEWSEDNIAYLADKVTNKISKEYKEPHVEQIQDVVENVLIEEGEIKVAKAYIRYRERHKHQREEWVKEELPLSIWTRKYQFKGESFEEFFDRIAGNNEKIRKLIKEKKFIPGGRILANRGLQKHGIKVTYSNCYVSKPPEDDLESIIEVGKRIARTFSYGGGSGVDISKLRPDGAKVNNAAKYTTGSVSFLSIYDEISKIVGQKNRRAALMISMIVNHPDIEKFIDKKINLNAITKANMSVRMTNNFMKAIKNNAKNYLLKFKVNDTGEIIRKVVNPTKIFNKLAYANWYSGEPGCLFWDRIENWNLLSEDDNFEYAGTNPCGEEPLPAGGSCNLGAINLSEFVKNPYSKNAKFDMVGFKNTIEEGIIYLNDILEEGLPLHPLKEQRENVKKWKQIGCGIMGLGSMLIKLGIKYGSQESLSLCDEIGFTMINAALQQSALLAKEKGHYPAYNYTPLDSDFIKSNATDKTIEMIDKYGLRNSQLLTIAPTGSISNLVSVSGGIEPIFKTSYIRKTETLHDEDAEYKIFDNTVKELMEKKNIKNENNLPDYVVDAHNLNYKDRINMQSIWQQYIDASISSTINLSNDATVEDIKNLYMYAWEKGLKGVTVYRDGCAREGILRGDKNLDGKQEMTDQDFIDAGICPECKSNLDFTGGCKGCSNCGFEVCGI